jgi:hypothetical protein
VQKVIDRLYYPVANFDNPVFFGLICMAQSAPSYTGLETLAGFDYAYKQSGKSINKVLKQVGPQPGTRLEALEELFVNFVQRWVGGSKFNDGGAITCALPVDPFLPVDDAHACARCGTYTFVSLDVTTSAPRCARARAASSKLCCSTKAEQLCAVLLCILSPHPTTRRQSLIV